MDTAEQIMPLLHEMVVWLRFQNRQTLRDLLKEILTTDSDKRVYEHTDGIRSQPEIARRAGVSQPTVSAKWKGWRTLGIVYDVPGEPGRCRHLTSLSSLGIEAPHPQDEGR